MAWFIGDRFLDCEMVNLRPLLLATDRFMDNGALVLDDRTMFHYFTTGITPAMAAPQVGMGSVYAFTAQDSDSAYLTPERFLVVHSLFDPAPFNA